MRVGFYVGYIQSPEIGGGSTFQWSVIEELKNITTKHDIYFYFRNTSEKSLLSSENLRFININSDTNRKLNFNDIIIRDKIEIVYFLTLTYEKINAPFVFTVWDLGHRIAPYFPEISYCDWDYFQREEFYSDILRRASRVIIGNNVGKREICKYYNVDEKNIFTNPMPTPGYVYSTIPDDSIIGYNKLEYQKYLFYPAQFWPHKNHIRLIKAMRILKEKNYNLKLVLTGSDKGNEKYIKEKVAEYALKDSVLFLGFVKKDEIISLYKNAFALVFASMLGPDNIPPLEAMALRCPVICSNTKGSKEQLGDASLFFDPLSEESLVCEIEKLKNDCDLRKDLIRKGALLSEKYSIKHYVSNMFEIIDNFEPIRECWSSKNFYSGENMNMLVNSKSVEESIKDIHKEIEDIKIRTPWFTLFNVYNNSEYIKIVILNFIRITIKVKRKNIDQIAGFIPIRRWRDNFRKLF